MANDLNLCQFIGRLGKDPETRYSAGGDAVTSFSLAVGSTWKDKSGARQDLCFQSKVGPEKWLEPSLDQTIDRLAAANVSHMLVVPIAFVSDHIETLSEINIEGKHRAKALGVRWFDMSPAINTHPDFIRCLADLVRKAAA